MKVALSSSVTVNQILRKARNHKVNDNFKTVFTHPALSHEERAKKRELVQELKIKEEDEEAARKPELKHFIRDGQVNTTDSG